MQTNIPWLPYVSDGWEIQKVKQCFFISKDISKKENPVVLTLARTGVRIRDISNNEGQMAASYDNYNAVVPGDLLLNPMDLYSGANCSLSEVSGVISPAYVNLRARVPLNPKFFDYYFKTQYWMMAMFAHGKGVSFDNRWTINSDAVLNYEIPFPTLKKQDSIVEFVNQKCAEIDSLMAVEEAQIDVLNEFKKSVIRSYAVNGFPLQKPMKNTSIRWIGKCPTDWRLVPAKRLITIENGSDPKIEGTIPVYGSGAGSFRTCGEYKDGPAVLLGRKGATLHIPHYITGKYWNVDTAFDVHTKTQELNLKYFYYLAICFDYEFYKSQTTLPSMTQTSYGKIVLPIPSITEQIEIVRSLEEKLKDIDSLITLKASKISQLEDYKKALVVECVTGKKEIDE